LSLFKVLARAAHGIPALVDSSVYKEVPAVATLSGAEACPSLQILDARDGLHVCGIDAGAIATEMVQREGGRDGTNQLLIHPSVSGLLTLAPSLLPADYPVTIAIETSRPRPALLRRQELNGC